MDSGGRVVGFTPFVLIGFRGLGFLLKQDVVSGKAALVAYMADITYDPELAAAEARDASDFPITWTFVGVALTILLNVCYCRYYHNDYKKVAGY